MLGAWLVLVFLPNRKSILGQGWLMRSNVKQNTCSSIKIAWTYKCFLSLFYSCFISISCCLWLWHNVGISQASVVFNLWLSFVLCVLTTENFAFLFTGMFFSLPLSAQCLALSLCSYSCLMARPCQLLYLHPLQAQVYIFQLQSLWVFSDGCVIFMLWFVYRIFKAEFWNKISDNDWLFELSHEGIKNSCMTFSH